MKPIAMNCVTGAGGGLAGERLPDQSIRVAWLASRAAGAGDVKRQGVTGLSPRGPGAHPKGLLAQAQSAGQLSSYCAVQN